MKGKPWTVEEEKRLRELMAEKNSAYAIARIIGKSLNSVKSKIRRLGLEEEDQQIQGPSSSNLISGFSLGERGELPNLEQALQVLSEALAALGTPGLDPNETLRLRSIIQGVKTYKELLTDYLDFYGLEKRLFELEAKYGELAKKAKGSQTSQ